MFKVRLILLLLLLLLLLTTPTTTDDDDIAKVAADYHQGFSDSNLEDC